jgi:flagellar hook protein FlgE
MSLTSSMFTGVSGLLSDANALNVEGNNLANVNTVGFRGGKTLFSTLLSSSIGNNSQVGNGVQVQAVQNQFAAGSYQSSTNVTDVAIQGSGFFALGAPTATAGAAVAAGAAYYTRAGSFSLDSSGLGLVNSDGYKVLDMTGTPIVFAANNGGTQLFQKVSGIDATGNIALLYADPATGISSTLYYAGAGTAAAATTATAVKVAEVTIPNPQGLVAQSGTLFTQSAASGTAAYVSANGTTEKFLSNQLESSNVDLGTELVNMLTTQRAYSANSKTITTADQMTQTVLSLVQ